MRCVFVCRERKMLCSFMKQSFFLLTVKNVKKVKKLEKYKYLETDLKVDLNKLNIHKAHSICTRTKMRSNYNKFTVQSWCFDQLTLSSVSPCHSADRRLWSEISTAPVLIADSPAERQTRGNRGEKGERTLKNMREVCEAKSREM